MLGQAYLQQGSRDRAAAGWLSGWLMVLPNASLALYYGWKRQPEVIYTSQVGDGHICIPLCLGLAAVLAPISLPPEYLPGLGVLGVVLGLHFCAILLGGLSRPVGWVLLAGYGAFLAVGLPG